MSTIKLPILKKGEYDIWAMKMEHYLIHIDYHIWEVIQKGNGLVSVSTYTNGVIKVLPPKTAEEILARERERKDAIKSRFGGNEESKKMQKYILKQQFEGFSVSPLKMSIRNSLGLYLLPSPKVFESDVKGSTGSSSSTAYGVSTSSGYNSQRKNSSSYTDELIRDGLEMASSYDINEIEEVLQEDRRRDAGNTGYRAKDNGRRPGKQEEPKAFVTLDGEGVDWTGHAEDEQENFALMAYSNSCSDTEVTSCSKECVESYA
ncbi:hypothetical protein Tco_1481495 [Tanacetum coccineum]